MRVAVLALCTAIAGCSWSNSLYHARRLSNSAQQAEREERSFDATSLWGQAAVKADSVLARDPSNAEGAWLRGQALARLGECDKAIAVLERSRALNPSAGWRDRLLLELGRCRILAGDHAAATLVLTPLLTASDRGTATEARFLAGRALITAGQWQQGLDQLAGLDRPAARVDRAVALAALDRTDEAIVELTPALEARDTTADWDRFLRLIAEHDPEDADRLVARLSSFPGINDTLRTRWQLAVAEGAMRSDRNVGARRLETLAGLRLTPSTSRARVILAERLIAGLDRGDSLRAFLASLGRLMDGDPFTALQVSRLYDRVDALADDIDSLPPGSSGGDMALFYQAENALLEMQSAALAAWLYHRIETAWPDSPYAPKALLARMMLQPDSALVLAERVVRRYPSSPYVRWFAGEEGPEFRVLDGALGQYIGDRRALAEMRRTTPRPVDVQE